VNAVWCKVHRCSSDCVACRRVPVAHFPPRRCRS
jgi:hypothetical protein